MRFANWFRITWWALLQGFLAFYLWSRWTELVAGNASAADIVVFLVLVALALAPIYEDVGILGISLKQHIRKIENEVSALRTDVRAAIDVRNQFAPSINIGPALAPDKLEQLAAEIRKQAQADGISQPQPTVPGPTEDAMAMFKVRFEVEREVRRVHDAIYASEESNAGQPFSRLVRDLSDGLIINLETARALEQVYRIASRSIHGQEVLPTQVAFALDTSGWILAELRRLR